LSRSSVAMCPCRACAVPRSFQVRSRRRAPLTFARALAQEVPVYVDRVVEKVVEVPVDRIVEKLVEVLQHPLHPLPRCCRAAPRAAGV